MIFNRNIPLWVKRLADQDGNKLLLTQLAKASKSPLDTPREINFSIKDIKSARIADAIEDAITKQGWKCKILKDSKVKGQFWVEGQKLNYAITKENIESDENFFYRIAKMYDAVYDGWFANVV